jgi:hypothetical protein
MVYQLLRQAHLKEVGSEQNWENMTLQIFAILDLLLLFFTRAHMYRMVMEFHLVGSPVTGHLEAHDHTKFYFKFWPSN